VSFFNIGPWELMVILAIAILLVGPKRVVEISRAIGRITSQMRKLSREFMGTIQAELQAAERDTRRVLESAAGEERRPAASIPAELQAVEREMRQVAGNVDGDGAKATTGFQAELRDTERETRQALEEIVEGIGDLVKGKR